MAGINDVQISTSNIVGGQKHYATDLIAQFAQIQSFIDDVRAKAVDLAEAQTIAGAKTFTGLATLKDGSVMASSAAPSANAQIANKKYIDDSLRTASSVAKAWCNFAADGTLRSGSYNVTSVEKTSTGRYTVTWTTDFANTLYAVNVTPHPTSSGTLAHAIAPEGTSKVVGSQTISTFNASNVAADFACSIVVFGAQ